jgi:hypothetical protein
MTYTTGIQQNPSIATDNNGNFIIHGRVLELKKYRYGIFVLKDITLW